MTFTLAIVSLCLTFFVGTHAGTTEKIVGGTTTSINEFPFQVSLRLNGRHFCGGSIIGEKHILTAAHCVRGIMTPPYTNIVVVSGSSTSSGSSGQTHRVKRADVHPGYTGTDASSYHDDVAVLTLSGSITFNGSQRKIDLPTADVQHGASATVSGWGIQKYPSNAVSPILMKAKMTIIPASTCMLFLPSLRVFNEQVCAVQRKGVGACSGDSGGPLSANNQVIGIASWVIPCGEGYPDVYTKVYAYKDWIKSIMARS